MPLLKFLNFPLKSCDCKVDSILNQLEVAEPKLPKLIDLLNAVDEDELFLSNLLLLVSLNMFDVFLGTAFASLNRLPLVFLNL